MATADYTQTARALRVQTALGPDALLLTAFDGTEGLSQLFRFHLEMVAPLDRPADFAAILGKPARVEIDLPGGQTRYYHGIISRFGQGRRDNDFIHYRAEMVPALWLLTKRHRSRIFQQKSVPDILREVLSGLAVTYQIQGTFHPRDYCAQYRESDFAFASRLMEEEGIYYFFKHTDAGHELVLANTPAGHPDLPAASALIYEEVAGGLRDEARVTEWEKVQEVRSGKVTLWDHCFELPHQHLDAEKAIQDSAQAGSVTHDLRLGGLAESLEVYDYPGGYAQRFDGIDPGGGDRAGDVQKIFEDNARTAGIRMQQEAAPAVEVRGVGNCAQMTAGHKFTLERHFDADGEYVLTSVAHSASLQPDYRSGAGYGLEYQNRFTCVPFALPYRPPLLTPRPTVRGTQTAVVVGPPGEEIFPDKYGRVKVQFHWDRDGRLDAQSSCWVRVATMWAGQNWGVVHIPRVGQEVVVAFEEGDPDRPIVVGSVYNADMMPPWPLPENKTQSGIQTRSSPGGGPANHNQIRFEDKKGEEQLHIHAERNQDIEVENDETHWVGHDRKKTIDHDETTLVKHDRTETVNNNETITVGNNRTESVGVNEAITVGGDRTRTVKGNEAVTVMMTRTHTVGINEAIQVGGAQEVTVGGLRMVSVGGEQTITVGRSQAITVGRSQTLTVKKDLSEKIDGDRTEAVKGKRTDQIEKDHSHAVKGDMIVSVDKSSMTDVKKEFQVEAGEKIVLKTGKASIILNKDGTIVIEGKDISLKGSGKIIVDASGDVKVTGSKITNN